MEKELKYVSNEILDLSEMIILFLSATINS